MVLLNQIYMFKTTVYPEAKLEFQPKLAGLDTILEIIVKEVEDK